MSDLNLAQPTAAPAIQPTKFGFSRLNLILLALLVAQVVVLALVAWPRTTANVDSGPLLPTSLSADNVTAITVSDTQSQTVTLERSDDGWTLAGTDGFPANGEEISSTLQSLLAISTDRLVTRTPESHRQLQVAPDDFQRRVELTTNDATYVLYLGSSTGATANHVRLDGQDATYLTGEIAAWELDILPSGWINTQYVTVPADTITAMSLTNISGTINLVREGETWMLEGLAEGETPSPANISALVNRAATVSLTRPLGQTEDPAYGLDQPQATVTLTVQDEAGTATTQTLYVGAKDEAENVYYFKSSESPYYVTIAAFAAEALINQQRSELLAQPEATTDAATDSATENAAGPAPVEAPTAPLSPTTSSAVTATATMTATMTATETVTATEPVTATDAITAPEAVTATEAATTTEAVTATDTVTTSVTVTE